MKLSHAVDCFFSRGDLPESVKTTIKSALPPGLVFTWSEPDRAWVHGTIFMLASQVERSLFLGKVTACNQYHQVKTA